MFSERITLVVLAYVIGFTTAFIAFAIPNIGSDSTQEVVVEQGETVHAAGPKLSVLVEDQNLYAVVDGQNKIISADDKDGTGRGFHHAISWYEVSGDSLYIDYCVFELPEDAECVAYRYLPMQHAVARI